MARTTLHTTLHSATIGARLHQIARALVPLVATVYVAGLATGDFVHWLNDRLAGRGRKRWAAPAKPGPVALLQLAATDMPVAKPEQEPITLPLPRLLANGLNVAQLRKEAARMGLSRTLYTRGRRAELIQALCAS
jgi:hypothetical protein